MMEGTAKPPVHPPYHFPIPQVRPQVRTPRIDRVHRPAPISPDREAAIQQIERPHPPPPHVEHQDGDLELCVADTGIGIAPGDQKRIFERFAQADSTTTRRFGGTGLGLALVKEFGELMGGTVAVESAIGQGARFTLRLPLQPAAATPSTWPLPVTDPHRWSSMQSIPGDTLPPLLRLPIRVALGARF